MNKFLVTLIMSVLLITLITVFAFTPTNNLQNIKSNHTVDRVGETNDYHITTIIAGMQDADIALVKYNISNQYTYNASEKNYFFSDRDNNYIKFFIMEIPNEGNVMVHLGVTVENPGPNTEFPVELEFSSNGKKQTVNLPAITLDQVLVGKNDEIEGEDSIIHTISTVDPKTMTTSTEVIVETSELTIDVVEEEGEEQPSLTPKSNEDIVKGENISQAPAPINASSSRYAVQLLALSVFSESRLNKFCNTYNIPISKVTVETMNGLTKVRYGSFDSEEEAKKLHQQLLNKNVEGVFIVELENN